MTAQRKDRVVYQGKSYLLNGIVGDSILFDPTDWGIVPRRFTTGAAKGFLCQYRAHGDRIALDQVQIGSATGEYPTIGGVGPVLESASGPAVYDGPEVHFCHTGSLLLCGTEENRTGEHLELVFEDGRLVKAICDPGDLAKFDNWWKRHAGVVTSVMIRDELRESREAGGRG